MPTYIAEPDTYAGWDGFGRQLSYCTAASAAITLTCWVAMHGGFGAGFARSASDQLFVSYLLWVSIGFGALATVGVLGSLVLSAKSKGTVIVDDVGVHRQIGNRRTFLLWEQIQGFVVMPTGGVTLIPLKGNQRIQIPRFLDDYRGCIREIKARNVPVLPSRFLREKNRWPQTVLTYSTVYLVVRAGDPAVSHPARIISLVLAIALAGVITLWRSEPVAALRWGAIVLLSGIVAWALFAFLTR